LVAIRGKEIFMKHMFSAFDLMQPTIEASKMVIEAQQVIALRMTGMAGIWSMGPAETKRRVDGTVAEITESARAMFAAGVACQSPGTVAMAAIGPLRRRTKANASRLNKKTTGGGA
jgi:hypothetical protein